MKVRRFTSSDDKGISIQENGMPGSSKREEWGSIINRVDIPIFKAVNTV